MVKNGLLGPLQRRLLLAERSGGPISTTSELAQLVADTVKTREPGQNPATRTFQAFRIFINAELEELQHALEASLQVLKPGGRLVVISFHSLEDRIVKQFIAKHSRDEYDRRAPFAAPKVMKLKAWGASSPVPTEVAGNARSRSADHARGAKDIGMIRLNLVLMSAVLASALYLVGVQYDSRRFYH
jgi:16S rRNA (cytosine1402-N4)-methyltransferase